METPASLIKEGLVSALAAQRMPYAAQDFEKIYVEAFVGDFKISAILQTGELSKIVHCTAKTLSFFFQHELFSLTGFLEAAIQDELNNLMEFIAIEPGSMRLAPVHHNVGAARKLTAIHQLAANGAGYVGPRRLSAGDRRRYLRVESYDRLQLFLVITDFLERIAIHPQASAGRALA